MKNIAQFIILLYLIFGFVSCSEQNNYPKELKFCFEYLDENLSQTEIEQFGNSDWTPGNSHFGIGLQIRNKLLQNHDYSENLVKFFEKNGIHHFDDMSGIIIVSYHKHLNNHKLELNKEFEKYRTFWGHFEDISRIKDSIALVRYDNFNIEDTIEIMTLLTKNSKYISEKPYLLDWKYNDSTDLKIKGVIIKKITSDTIDELEMKIRILEKSNPSAHYGSDTFDINDTISIPFKTTWIMKKN